MLNWLHAPPSSETLFKKYLKCVHIAAIPCPLHSYKLCFPCSNHLSNPFPCLTLSQDNGLASSYIPKIKGIRQNSLNFLLQNSQDLTPEQPYSLPAMSSTWLLSVDKLEPPRASLSPREKIESEKWENAEAKTNSQARQNNNRVAIKQSQRLLVPSQGLQIIFWAVFFEVFCKYWNPHCMLPQSTQTPDRLKPEVGDVDSWLPHHQPIRRTSMSWSHTSRPLSLTLSLSLALTAFGRCRPFKLSRTLYTVGARNKRCTCLHYTQRQ